MINGEMILESCESASWEMYTYVLIKNCCWCRVSTQILMHTHELWASQREKKSIKIALLILLCVFEGF